MGNIRLSYFRNGNNSAEVLEENNYYPFGLKHEGYNAQPGNASYTYQYNSKELQRETGWNDYGARMYMSDIGRWGVVDPLAETSRRYTPYHYALNNPVRFIDPDGRKALPPDQDRQLNIPVNGFAFYFASGGSGRTKAIQRFFGPGDGLGEFFNMDNADEGGGGGGSSTTIGDIMRSVGITLGSLQSFMQMNVVLSLRQQLVNAGWKNPETASAKFTDWMKLVTSDKISSLKELYEKTNSGGYNLKFIENSSLSTPGRADIDVIQINMNKNQNLLEYAFTIGHEMTHSFTDLHFKEKFHEIYNERDGRYMREHTYNFFKEVIGLGWEIKHGSTRYNGLSDANAVIKYYPQIDARAINKIQPYLNLLRQAWQKTYNSK